MEKNKETQNKLVYFSIRNPHFILVSCFFVLIMGVLAALSIPKDLLPSANLPAVQILSFYPGMPVERTEKNLTARFERATGQAIGLDHQESKSLLGVSVVRNYFNQDTDLNSATSQTTTIAMSVLSRLPPGTQPPLILPFDPMASVPLAIVAVSGDKDETALYDTARYEVRNAVQSVPGAIAPTVMGGSERQAVIYVRPEKLKYFNLSALDIVDNISHLNTFIPTGNIKIGKSDYQIISNGIVDEIKEMDEFPVRSENGTEVYIRDVGHAEDSRKIQTNIVTINGKEQVYVPLYRQPGANSLEVVQNVAKAVKRLGQRLPGFNLKVIADQSVYIRKAMSSIFEEILIGGMLAILMVLFFLSDARATLGIFICVPLSFLFSLIGLKVMGQTINAMTLGGLAVSIGIIVDNSIVVLENINRKLEEGKPPRQAAIEGASEVATPVMAATLATLVVLFPVVFLTGISKILFAALAKAKVVALIGSYFSAMCVMPLFASFCFRKTIHLGAQSAFQSASQTAFRKIEVTYSQSLTWACAHGKKVVVFVLCVLGGSLLLVPRIGTELFPRADSGGLILEMRQASGTRIEETKKLSLKVEQKLREWIPEKDLLTVIANEGVAFGYAAAFTTNSGSQDVFFTIELSEQRKQSSQAYAKLLREKLPREFPGVEIGIQLGGLMTSALNSGLRAPIDIQIEGRDSKVSHQLAEELKDKIKELRGAVDTRIQQRLDAPQINVNVDRKKALALGLATDEIIKSVVSAVSGSSSFYNAIWIDPKTGIDYPLGVQFPEDAISTFDMLSSIPITGHHQDRGVALDRLATITQSQGPTEVHHVNLNSIVDIFMDAQDRDIGSLSREVQTIIDQFQFPAGYSASIQGEISEMKSSVSALGGGFMLAALFVYLILVVQFRSFSLPAIIMITVPLGIIGVILALYLTHTNFSIQAAIGSILMVGIAVANGVLLIDFIDKEYLRTGQLQASVLKGSIARLRPILMTSFASILGLLPMAIGWSAGSEANIPLGRAVVGGQMVSTLLTLFLVPLLYLALESRRAHQRMKEIPDSENDLEAA